MTFPNFLTANSKSLNEYNPFVIENQVKKKPKKNYFFFKKIKI
jgi:hypothetical protein